MEREPRPWRAAVKRGLTAIGIRSASQFVAVATRLDDGTMGFHFFVIGSESQRDSGPKPRVASPTSYPGNSFVRRFQPQRGCGACRCLKPQPRWGCCRFVRDPQGSSCLATAGLEDTIPLGLQGSAVGAVLCSSSAKRITSSVGAAYSPMCRSYGALKHGTLTCYKYFAPTALGTDSLLFCPSSPRPS